MRRVGRSALTVTAALGTLCLVLALAGVAAGVRPLVFRSGSMGPAIPAGALGLARPVDAADISVGDIVSVIAADGTRVTHRVVQITGASGPTRFLTLRGDANPVPDRETYEVSRVDRVLVAVPWLGYAVTFLATPLGLLLLGAGCGALLLHAFRRSPEDAAGGRHRVAMASLPPLALALVVVHAAPTSATFTDGAAVAGGTLAAATLPPPTTPRCTNNLLSTPTLAWTAPTSGPPPSGYRITIRGTGINVGTTAMATTTGTSWQFDGTLIGLLGVFTLSVQSTYQSWTSASLSLSNVNVTAVLGTLGIATCA